VIARATCEFTSITWRWKRPVIEWSDTGRVEPAVRRTSLLLRTLDLRPPSLLCLSHLLSSGSAEAAAPLGRVPPGFVATTEPELSRELAADGFNLSMKFLYALPGSEAGQLHQVRRLSG